MSGDKKADATVCCASCGIAEIDDIKLMPCDGCDLVKYCSDECKRDHKSEHEEACKKRTAELHDELLFKQPESTHLGDCPICSLPLPLERSKSSMYYCCSKKICDGCVCANIKRQVEMRLEQTCPFCREPTPKVEEENDKRRMKRIEANDLVAMCDEGIEHFERGDYRCAFEYWTKAAEAGDAYAHYRLAHLYNSEGLGVEKDIGKEMYHTEEAAIGGNPDARYNLGWFEDSIGNIERAIKHWIIAATQGDDEATKSLMKVFKDGLMSKEILTTTLRAHQAAVDATKSKQRKEGEDFLRSRGLK